MSHGRFTILHIEDDHSDVFFAQEAFRRVGLPLDLQVVRDGDDALEYLEGRGDYADRKRHPLPSLILLDLKLPRKSGLEVLQWLRRQPGLKRIPVIVLTSSTQASDIDRAYDLGANAYLVKPMGLEKLQEIVGAIHAFWVVLNKRPSGR